MAATATQRPRILERAVPARSISLAEPIASGRLETKIATRRPTPTPAPPARPMPSTSCSGMPSRKAPRASAVPLPLPSERPCRPRTVDIRREMRPTRELASSAPQPIADPISATFLAMTLFVKLGSSIVAADDGELRTEVLDSVCEQVAQLEQGGERV